MNERIRELALQANARELGWAYYRGEKRPENAVELHSVDLELFALLIIRQCMNLAKDCYEEPESSQSPYQTVCASTIIEEYFGVE